METTKIYTFKLASPKNWPAIKIDALNEESARRKLIRRRNQYRTSYAHAYQAELIEVKDINDQSVVAKLYEELQKETKSFKRTYLKKAKKYIIEDFDDTLKKFGTWDYQKWIDKYGVEKQDYWPNRVTGKMEVDETYKVPSSTMIRLRDKTKKFLKINETKKTYNEYIKAEVEKYSKDFEFKLHKLAGRLEGKGFNTDLKVKSQHIGANFDCWVTDGINAAHAYTIIAEGPIQRPHYRYLIK